MPHTFHELKSKTVAELREIASGLEHEAVQGFTQLNKEHLLVALCKALGVDAHEHRRVQEAHKTEIKGRIRQLKKSRDSALEAHDHAKLKAVRRRIHRLKRRLHKNAVRVPAAAPAQGG